jgi:hypothetical protein
MQMKLMRQVLPELSENDYTRRYHSVYFYIWADLNGPFSVERLSTAMKREFFRETGCDKIGFRAFRHINKGWLRNNLINVSKLSPYYEFLVELLGDQLSGHEHQTAWENYAVNFTDHAEIDPRVVQMHIVVMNASAHCIQESTNQMTGIVCEGKSRTIRPIGCKFDTVEGSDYF